MDERRQRRWRLGWAGAVLAASITAIGVVPSLADPGDPGRPLLPDLVQAPPTKVKVRQSGTDTAGQAQWDLSFDSAVDNVGEGPLVIKGSRADEASTMTATQFVDTDTPNAQVTYPDAGSLRYVPSPDHSHWHLDAFDRYELRRAGEGAVVRPDRKTGFCIGDRYNTDRTGRLPGEPTTGVYTGYCEPNKPQSLSVIEGMSVGYGDNYQARLEGQSIDVTGLPAGNYVLTHHVNADGRIRELRTDNNTASVPVTITWPAGPAQAPAVSVGPATTASPAASKPGLPTMSAPVARYFVRQSLIRRFGKQMRKLRSACEVRTRTSFSCRVRFTRSGWTYRGRVWVGHALDGARVTYRRRIDVTGRRSTCRRKAARCARRVQLGP